MDALQCLQLQKNIENDVITIHSIWKGKRLSSTPNQITSLPSTGHISPSLGGRDLDSPGHQCKSLKCLWQILHIRWHQNVTNTYFITAVFLLGVQWGGKAGRTASPGRPPLFREPYALLTFQMLQFNFSSRSPPLHFRTTPLLSSVAQHSTPRNRLWKRRRRHTVHCTVRW